LAAIEAVVHVETERIAMSAFPCPNCGSKRTTAITPTSGQPASVWCHQCGSVSQHDDRRDDALYIDDDGIMYAVWMPKSPIGVSRG
jgi:hypothetical protein